MLTQWWHALNNLCDAMQHVGTVQTLHAGDYEPSHKRFKAVYFCFSCRKWSAIDEVIVMHNDDMIKNKSIFAVANTEERKDNPCVSEKLNFKLQFWLDLVWSSHYQASNICLNLTAWIMLAFCMTRTVKLLRLHFTEDSEATLHEYFWGY